MNYRKLILVLFLFLSALGLLTLRGPLSSANQTVVDTELASSSFLELDYIKEEAVIHKELLEAKNQALVWKKDANLVAISMEFNRGLHYDFLEQYNYVFDSPTADNYWIINNPIIKESSSQAYAENDLFGDVQLEAIQEEYLKINFVHVLEIVERAGGYSFRVNHMENYTVTLLLIQPQDGVLSWYVSYSNDQEEQVWKVNASSGSIQAQ